MSKAVSPASRRPWHSILYVQVLLAIALAILLGYAQPKLAVEMKPLGDAFIKLIKMAIGLVIFFTVVSGIGGMQSMKKVGRVGGKALIYFEVVSTLALVIGMLVGNWLTPGAGFNADPAKLDATAVGQYAGKAHEQSVIEFLLNIIPNTIVDAFAKGDILPIVLVSIVIGYALARLGEKGRPIRELIDAGNNMLFAAINALMRLVLGIDRFMSEARSLVNMIGNAVATVVMAAWEGELDRDRLRLALDGRLPPAERQLPPVVVPPGFPE